MIPAEGARQETIFRIEDRPAIVLTFELKGCKVQSSFGGGLGIGFQLLASFERTVISADEILAELENWVSKYAIDLAPSTRIGSSEKIPTLFCKLHPAEEELELSIVDLDHLLASARTSNVGPGYHIFVCDMLRKLGQAFHLSWNPENEEYVDEGDYFFSMDPGRVFDEMTNWLAALCGCFFNGLFRTEAGDMPTALCLPVGVSFEWDARAVTPLGPRDLGWLKEVSDDGSKGRNFFAWWNPELDAKYFLGRALACMWTEVRWRNPINEKEREVLEYVANSLETAFKLDPTLRYPWPEWKQIFDLLDRHDPELRVALSNRAGVPEIGYRRRDVAVTLPGYWVLKLPGSFSDFDSDEEGDFSAEDPPRVVWFTSYRFVENSLKMFADARKELLERRSLLLEEREGYIGQAEIEQKSDDETTYFVLTSSNVCAEGRSILSIVFTNPEQRGWAETVWRSLQPPRTATNK